MSSLGKQAIVPEAILNDSEWQNLNSAVQGFNAMQLTWASGYLAGLAQASQPVANVTSSEATAEQVLTVLYGSQTGNAKGIASQFAEQFKATGYQVKLVNMADFKPKQIKDLTHLAIVVSTHGEGDAPDDAVQLHEYLASKKAPKLPQLKYTVLGLGDSSYEYFCQTAKDFDERLNKLGAQPMLGRVDCDVDYDAEVDNWTSNLNAKLKDEFKPSSVVPMPGINIPSQSKVASALQYNKKNPFAAELIESIKITGRDSVKDIRHVEIDLANSGLNYVPGDALGVWFENDPELISRLLSLVDIDGEVEVTIKEQTNSIFEMLKTKLELTQSYPGFVQKYAALINNTDLNDLLSDKAALRDYLSDRQITDVVSEFPAKVEAQAFVDCLRPLMPRLYSIASSQSEVEDEVHLTVGLVEYDQFGFQHQGGASGFLSNRISEGQKVKVYIEKNQNFKLPENSDTPVIMIGPGTGIAPFRAFMQEREAQEAEGKNWLFFGNPHFTQDFLYQVEWQKYLKDGLLSRISLAFSRDQEQKVYVQHRILEEGAELYKWLQDGAHIYVCGDADHMAKDVNDALVQVVMQYGDKDQTTAEQYLNDLRRNKRYQKDVY